METIDYQKQGVDFLTSTGTKMRISFLKHGKHFEDDKESRDIYRITLERNKRQYGFNFGQSLAKSGKKEKPTAYDVLTCLTKYDPGTFENFCGDYGYDTDSRKAEKVYKAVQNEYLQISRLFSDSELELMQEIQ